MEKIMLFGMKIEIRSIAECSTHFFVKGKSLNEFMWWSRGRSTQSEGGCAHKLAFLFSVIFYNHERKKRKFSCLKLLKFHFMCSATLSCATQTHKFSLVTFFLAKCCAVLCIMWCGFGPFLNVSFLVVMLFTTLVVSRHCVHLHREKMKAKHLYFIYWYFFSFALFV